MSNRIKLKVLRENPHTAIRTVAVVDGWQAVAAWLESQGKVPADTVRSFRVNRAGQITFKCGVGYDVIDDDLLGGDGSGRTRSAFERETNYGFSY